MLGRTVEYINEYNLLKKGDKLLLAVSGGIDSMVMLDIFRNLGHNISVAHCNFLLRAKESDEDHMFVESYCENHNVPFYSKCFNTSNYASDKGYSIQMAARELRYYWFEEIRDNYSLDLVLLAHNQNDIVETFMINLSRGTGLKGLSGIKAISGSIRRPLLFATRDDIEAYASTNNVAYREDSSNRETVYKRNLVRHKLLPLFKELNPSFHSSMQSTIKKLEESEALISESIQSTKSKLFDFTGEHISVKVSDLQKLTPIDIYIYELFKDFGVGNSGVDEIKKLFGARSGKHFTTESHRLYKDRDKLFIKELSESVFAEEITLSEEDLFRLEGYDIALKDKKDVSIKSDHNIAYFDYEKLVFPLIIRQWKEGDWFYPFGMSGKKKLSDLFVDSKVPMHKKHSIKIFTTKGDIIWVAGYRIDKRYSISDNTAKVLIIKQNN